MLRLNHIKKLYNKTEVLSDVNYVFEKGNIYPILGNNGSGRTTLFECISGDIKIDEGAIVTKEKSILFLAAKQSVLPMYITGYEYIRFICKLKGIKEEPDVYLDKVHMSEESRDLLICECGFEDKKRLQLAAFLVQRPYVIMFDEPFDYCSEQYINEFLEVLNSVKDEHIILISTGQIEISRKISKNTIVLNEGELHYITEEAMKLPEIRQAIFEILGEADNGDI